MPDKSSTFCTKAWMQEIFFLECWCPMKAEISFKTCMAPPPGRDLCDIICRMIEDEKNWGSEQQEKTFKRMAIHLRRHLPPSDWMLGLLSKMSPDHEVFQKGYQPPKR